MRWNFDRVIIPFFGAATPITSITTEQIQKLVIQRKRLVKPKTVWHDVTNLRACLNWAKEKNLLAKNPVDGLDMSIIGNTKPKKAPLNLRMVERAAAALSNSADRAYFDFLRFTGLRKDEANRLLAGMISTFVKAIFTAAGPRPMSPTHTCHWLRY